MLSKIPENVFKFCIQTVRNRQTDRHFNNTTVVIMIWTRTKRHKGAVAGHAGACKRGVGAQANRV